MAKKNKKSYTLDRKKFLIIVFSIVVIISVIIIVVSLNKKIEINDSTDISKLNATKYCTEIKSEYNKDENKNKFIDDCNKIQEKIGMYIINNSTLDDTSFENLILKLNENLADNNFSIIEMESPTYWNGTWSVDNKGKLKFKFSSKKIEPNWISDVTVSNFVITN